MLIGQTWVLGPVLAVTALTGCSSEMWFKDLKAQSGPASQVPVASTPAPAPVDKVQEAMATASEYRSCLVTDPVVANIFTMVDDDTVEINRVTMTELGCLGKRDFSMRKVYSAKFNRLEEGVSRVELTLEKVYVASYVTNTVGAYNQTSYCGKTNWANGVEQDCTDANSSLLAGQKIYYTMKLVNGEITTQIISQIQADAAPTDYTNVLKNVDEHNVLLSLAARGTVSFCDSAGAIRQFSMDSSHRLHVTQTYTMSSGCTAPPSHRYDMIYEVMKGEHQSAQFSVLDVKLVDLGVTFYASNYITTFNSSPQASFCNITDWVSGVERMCKNPVAAPVYYMTQYLTLSTDGSQFFADQPAPSLNLSDRATMPNVAAPFVGL